MFSKFFKKKQETAEVNSVKTEAIPAATEANPASPVGVAAWVAWEGQLKAAIGNDCELLALAVAAPSIEHKLSAVLSLSTEDGLKSAVREFRKQNRRVYGFAKQRYETMVKQRETRASAAELIQAATALIDAPMIPSNRLVEINQAWDLLTHELIEEEFKLKFAQLQGQLAGLMRERGERKRDVSRWSTTATQVLAALSSACKERAVSSVGQPELANMLTTARENARTALVAMPSNSEEDALAQWGAAIQLTIQDSELIETKLALLDELQSYRVLPPVESKSIELKEESQEEVQEESQEDKPAPSPAVLISAAIERWQALPLIADSHIENALKARFNESLQSQNETRKKVQKQKSHDISEKDKETQQIRIQALTAAVDAAEIALTAGHLVEAGTQLTYLQAAAEKGGFSAALQTRIGALQSEFLRLKDWQHWGGGRVREDLVVEAEVLAASTVVVEGARPVKLPIKQIENSIEQLRARWKELDRLGGATSKPLWLRFDVALKTAYLPVAAHLTQLNETRQENLNARKNLLATLDALNLTADGHVVPDWKAIGRALVHFQTEWRKLGPIEHTVPHKSQAALLERMKVSVARLETPLKEAQVSAQAEREQLIVRAKALSQDVQSRDMLAKLRELQSQWQSHAKSQPLPRKVENLLWSEFKVATDALMNQREAAFSARDSEFKANQTAREALIAQLEALNQDTSPADIKRILVSVDAEWRKAGEVARNQAEKLDSKYRVAREQAQEYVTGSALRIWQLTCDALIAKLVLCEELESAAPSDDIATRWGALPALPAYWELALQTRYQSTSENSGAELSKNVEPLDPLLLQLESLLEIPSPEAFQMDRRSLKLQAMKNAMEGRRSANPVVQEIQKLTAVAFGYRSINADQRNRFQSIIAALRKLTLGGL